jgi:hypothetical protein
MAFQLRHSAVYGLSLKIIKELRIIVDMSRDPKG